MLRPRLSACLRYWADHYSDRRFGDTTYNGDWMVISTQPDGFRLVNTRPASDFTFGIASDIVWSVAGITSSSPGYSLGNFYTIQYPSPCYLVSGLAPYVDQVNCWKEWMSIKGSTSNPFINSKIHRIFGSASNSSVFIAGTIIANSGPIVSYVQTGPTLPDYGTGTDIGTANLVTYHGLPVFRLTGFSCTVENILVTDPVAPAFVCDGTAMIASAQFHSINNCSARLSSLVVFRHRGWRLLVLHQWLYWRQLWLCLSSHNPIDVHGSGLSRTILRARFH